MQMGLFL